MDKKLVAVLEITSKSLRIVVGYVYDEQVYVIYALNVNIPRCIANGKIVDEVTLINEIKKISHIEDVNAKLKVNISDVVLVLPPYGLEIFQTKQATNVINEEGKVGNIDIRNLHSLINKEKIANDCELVDIIPDCFILDQDRSFKKPPIGEKSADVVMTAMVHTLPSTLVKSYINVVRSAGINVSRVIVSSQGACEYLSDYEEVPNDYFLIDVGARMTSVSFIGKNQLFGSTFFNWGSDNIDDKIIESFNCNANEASKFKILYGYDTRKLSFSPFVYKQNSEEGSKIFYVNDLNQIIKSEMDIFVDKLNLSINELLKGYDPNFKNLNAVFIGGGSLLKGLKKYVEPKIPCEKIICVMPKTLGARNPCFFNCLGVLKAHDKYQGGFDDFHPKISQISRNL